MHKARKCEDECHRQEATEAVSALLVVCGRGKKFSGYGKELEAEEIVPEVTPKAWIFC